MKFLKIVALYIMFVLSVNAEDIGGVPSASIVQAIKSNPNILNSPQAQQAMQQKGVTASEVLQKVDQVSKPSSATPAAATEEPTNKVDTEKKSDEKKADMVKEEPVAVDADVTQMYRSPLTVEKTNDYAKRLLSRQIKGQASALQRYGFEFFSNKNGMDLSSLPVPESYRLVPKDVLSVILYGPKSDNMSLTVDKEGNIVIPSFGPLHIAGLSFAEAKKTISDALMAAFPNVGVTVNITQFSTIQVTLAGEVATPGIYNVSSFSTVKEALISAGGLSKNGSMRSVLIKRGGRVYKDIDLYTIIRGSGRSDPLLQAGDIIVVPVMGKSIVVDGDVKRPAIYEAKSNTTIGELIYLAGGLSAEANKNDIRITRYEAHQRMSAINVSLAEAKKMVAMDQDSVYVHGLDRSNLRGITLFGNVVKPGFWPLPKEGMGLRDFFKQEIAQNTLRGVFLEDTYFDYAIIKRIKSNLKEEIIGFSLAKVLNGEEKISLYSRDQLFILNRSTVTPPSIVKISGECIARPGEYRFFDKMTFESLMSTVGTTCAIDRKKVTIVSPDPVAMTLKVRVVDTLQEKTVPLKEFDDIRTIGFFTTNPIKQAVIIGEVYKPESYPISEATTLKDIILAAGGLTKLAFLDRARISRTLSIDGKKFITQEFFLSLQDINKDAASFSLMDKDSITVYSIDELNVRPVATVNGEVYKAGSFNIDQNKTTVRDLILAAGGVTLKADQKIEIVRYSIKDGKRISTIIPENINHAMGVNSPKVVAYDEINLFSIPEWGNRRSIKLVGKVRYPGEYTIQKGEKLADVLIRAGGFTDEAFLTGAVFTRTDIKKIQTDAITAQINELEHKATIIAATPKSSTAGTVASSDSSSLMAMIGSLKEQAKTLDIPGRMTVRLEDDLVKLAQSPYNVSLKDGDALYIPEREDSVTIVGEVMNPSAVIHTTDKAKMYIDHAGGLKESADESNIFVIHANGEAEKVNKNFYTANATVGVGDSIVVPIKLDAYPTMLFVKDISSILYQFAITVAALHSIGSI